MEIIIMPLLSDDEIQKEIDLTHREKEMKLHTDQEPKPKKKSKKYSDDGIERNRNIQSVSLYDEDMALLEKGYELFDSHSKKTIYYSTVFKVCLILGMETIENEIKGKKSEEFLKRLKYLIAENS
jgi:hypothetical protein